MTKERRKPSLLQVFLALGGFLALAFTFTKLDIPIHLAIFSGWFLVIGIALTLGYSYDELEQSIMTGIYEGLDAVIILLVVGALIGTWISGGIVPTLIYYGLKIIKPSIFLLATMILCAITSISTGTSWGTAGTAGVAMMGIGAGLGVPAPITVGAILSGAYFGDKISPLSDSTIMASSLSGVDVIDHIKGMLPVSGPAFIITAIAFTIVGFTTISGEADMTQVHSVMAAMEDIFNITPLSLIPMIITIVMLVFRVPSIPAISFGSVLGMIWGVVLQGLDPVSAITTAWIQIPQNTGMVFIDSILSRGGIASMLESIAIIILGLGYGGLLDHVGVLEVITNLIGKGIKNAGSLTIITLIVGFLGNLFGSAMYVSLILTPKIMAPKYDELRVDRRVLSRNSEFGGTLTSGMIPWSDNGVFMTTVLGVSTIEYIPYMWLSFVCAIIAIIYSYTDTFMFTDE